MKTGQVRQIPGCRSSPIASGWPTLLGEAAFRGQCPPTILVAPRAHCSWPRPRSGRRRIVRVTRLAPRRRRGTHLCVIPAVAPQCRPWRARASRRQGALLAPRTLRSPCGSPRARGSRRGSRRLGRVQVSIPIVCGGAPRAIHPWHPPGVSKKRATSPRKNPPGAREEGSGLGKGRPRVREEGAANTRGPSRGEPIGIHAAPHLPATRCRHTPPSPTW